MRKSFEKTSEKRLIPPATHTDKHISKPRLKVELVVGGGCSPVVEHLASTNEAPVLTPYTVKGGIHIVHLLLGGFHGIA